MANKNHTTNKKTPVKGTGSIFDLADSYSGKTPSTGKGKNKSTGRSTIFDLAGRNVNVPESKGVGSIFDLADRYSTSETPVRHVPQVSYEDWLSRYTQPQTSTPAQTSAVPTVTAPPAVHESAAGEDFVSKDLNIINRTQDMETFLSKPQESERPKGPKPFDFSTVGGNLRAGFDTLMEDSWQYRADMADQKLAYLPGQRSYYSSEMEKTGDEYTTAKLSGADDESPEQQERYQRYQWFKGQLDSIDSQIESARADSAAAHKEGEDRAAAAEKTRSFYADLRGLGDGEWDITKDPAVLVTEVQGYYGTLLEKKKEAERAKKDLEKTLRVSEAKEWNASVQAQIDEQDALIAGYDQQIELAENFLNSNGIDTRTGAERFVGRILGTNPLSVTGEEMSFGDWMSYLGAIGKKGLSTWNKGAWNTVDMFFGDIAQEIHVLGMRTINDVIGAVNDIPGVEIPYLDENSRNLITYMADDARAWANSSAQQAASYSNRSAAAQIVDKYGTATVAAIPMAIETAMFGWMKAADVAAQGVNLASPVLSDMSTSALRYISGINTTGVTGQTALMAEEGMKNLLRNPMFWTSYIDVAGNSFEEAQAAKLNGFDAFAYATVNGFFNAMVEVGGADEALGGIQKLAEDVTSDLGGRSLRDAAKLAKDMLLEEGIEEVVQGPLERGLMQAASGDPVSSMFTLDPSNTRAAFNPATAAEEFAGGAFVGGVLGSTRAAFSRIRNAVSGSESQGASSAAETVPEKSEYFEGMSLEEAKKKYRELAKQYHPDVNPDGAATMQAINNDYEAWLKRNVVRAAEAGSRASEEQARAEEQGDREAAARAQQEVNNAVQEIVAYTEDAPEGLFSDPVIQEAVDELKNAASPEEETDAANAWETAIGDPDKIGERFFSGEFAADTETTTPAAEESVAPAESETAESLAPQEQTQQPAKPWKKGTVSAENIKLSDLRRKFNDTQNTSYRLLTTYAELSGVDIVLYESQPDAEGNYPEKQGRFQWKDDKIYIDINSGLLSSGDVHDLGKYVMMRTFGHEFSHFIEKWNEIGYNGFKETLFTVMRTRGEDVEALISKAQKDYGGISQEQASREVVAEAMSDVLPDSNFARKLAQDHPNVFKRLLSKLRDFTARLKQLFRKFRGSSPREARVLKENGEYLQEIVDMYDKIAVEAVENYQKAQGSTEAGKKAEAKKEETPKKKAPEKKQEKAEEKPAEKKEEPKKKEKPFSSDNIFKKDAAEKIAESKPATEIVQKMPTAEAPAEASTPEGADLRKKLGAEDSVRINGFQFDIFGMKSTTVNMRDGGTTTGTTYQATIRRVKGSRFPVLDGRALFDQTFPTREEAIDALVEVAENNELLETAASRGMEVVSNGESENQAPDRAGKMGDRSDGAGAVRVSSELEEGRVQGSAAERGADSVPAENGRRAGRDGDQLDAERDGRSGSEGSSESGVSRGHDELKAEQQRQQEETHAAVEHDVAEKSTVKAGGTNYVIGDSLDLPNGQKARYKANVEAIRLVKQLEADGRIATPEEQEILSKYVGWGGISDAFDKNKPAWKKEFDELKGLLTEDEYAAASASTLNAHYTSIPVIKAMYRGLQKLGYQGGRMLEPSSGVGNFVGAMPTDMSSSVKSWTMVELDNITGLIAKHLYPQADVRIEGFEKAIIPDNFIDVAIGNVPFGNFPIVDRAYPKSVTAGIHNYFFAKTLDKVRPGGIVMFITSRYTMNSKEPPVRRYIAKHADLLGAIRLPNNAFSGNAGTDVVTDILILKKRAPGTPYGGVPFVETNYDWRLGGEYQNEYFTAHPEMVLGEQVTTRGMYRSDEYTVKPFTDRGSLESQIDKAFESIEGKMDYPKQMTPEKTNYAVERADKKTKQGGLVSKDGKIYQNDGGQLTEIQTDEKTAKRITGMLQIRDLAQGLLNAQMQGQTEQSISEQRKALNKAYDAFVKQNGYLNSPANKKALANDPDKYSLYALENWNPEKKTATKADIFTVDTVKPNRTITHVDTIQEGLIVSRNTTGGIDVDLISRLSGRSTEDVTRELVESEAAFKDRDGNLVPAEVYLSGNVRAKLRDAQGMVGLDKDYQHNVDALQQIVPKDIPHEAIFVQPGTPWIPDSVYSDFAAYMLGGNNHKAWGGPDIQIHRSNETGAFTIDLQNKSLKSRFFNTQKYGTPERSFLNLFEAMMNSRSVTVSHKGPDGKSYVDKVATAAANEKIEQIRNEFQKWLWEDEERTKDLEYLYNETFNAIVTPKYDGSNLTVNGLRAGWGLRPHQADAVQRVVSSGGNTLLAHRVGAGKTLEMAAAAMKLRELGIVKKPMFAVPKALVAQWGNEFKTYFPNAKLLVAEQGDFTPGNRKTFANRISTGNYDAVIVSYEQFEKIPMSDSFTLKMYRDQINEIINAIEEAKAEAGQKSMSVKDLEKKRKQLQAKIDKLTDKAKDTDSIEFEQLGVDSIFVDEAHNFKNLFYTTSMNNVAGLGNRDGSKRAFDLYTKVRYLQQLNGGRGIVFATATPVMNSMSEMYIMQKYLQPDLLKQLGLSTFDAWAKQFGEVVNGLEIKPSGQGYRVKQSFSRFKNMSELQLLFRNFSDVLTQIPGLKIPKMKGGKVQVIESEAGEYQQNYMKELEKRADNIKNVDPSEDNMLKITSDGRKISYTQRMIDPSLPYEEGCKIYQCADKVLEEYKASKKNKGTQIIFLDMATPKGKTNSEKAAVEEADIDTESAQLYDDLKARLVKLGIPAKEIAFIHDADTDQKKSKLFADMNDGTVRVLIGSTGKMGVGMNAQKRIVAIHHLDAPWRPGDVEQRDGRAFRQGNINDEVSKYVYVTKGSFDARLWDILGRKATFIDQIMNGENVGREVEDTGEVTLSAAEIKALASDNPLIGEQVQLEKEIKDLENLYLAHNASVAEARKKLQTGKQQRAEVEKRIENAKTDLANRGDGYGDDDFRMKIGNRNYTDKKKAGEDLMAAATAKANKENYTKIGSFAGFDILAIETKEGFKGLLRGTQGYAFNFYPDQTTRMITRLQNMVKGLDTYIEEQQGKLSDINREVKGQEELIRQPFEKQGALDKKRARYNEIMDILNPKEEQAISESEDDEDRVEYSYRGRDSETGKSIYQSNFPKGTPKQAKAAVILHYIQNVWSKKPIRLKIRNDDGSTRTIYAQFDPAYDPSGNIPTDASKMMAGNRHGTSSEQRVTLDLAQDYYQIAEESVYNYSKPETGKDKATHEGVKQWHYFVDDILFQEYGKEETAPYRVTINVKEKADGSYVYSFNAERQEKEPSTRRTLHADVNQSENGEANAQLSNAIVEQNNGEVKGKPSITQEFSSADTSRPQVAALFKSRVFQPEDINIDIGGGKYNFTTEYLEEEYGTTNMVYDPFNRGRDENLAVIDFLREGNRADTATCANVLNVIKEPEARANVILEVAKAIKEDGTAYFSVYEKDKSGAGRQTGADSWQNSRKTADYVSEIEEYFDDVQPPKDGVIVATNPKADLPKAFWRVTEGEEIEYANRRNALSNAEILEMAAGEIDTSKFSEAERNALDAFQEKLTKLQEAQGKRMEMGRQYKEQQFTKGGSRTEAEKIRARMKIMDERIQRLQNDLVSLENKDVLRGILDQARTVVETAERKRGNETLQQYRARRNESDAAKKYRARIRAQVLEFSNLMTKPSSKDIRKHVPAEIQKTLVDFLDCINLSSKTMLATSGLETTKADEQYLKAMKKLHDAIKENVDARGLYSGYADLPPDFLDNFSAMIRKAEEMMENHSGTFIINQMTGAELKELSRTLRTLKKFITTMNTFHNNAMFQHVDEAGDNTVAYLSGFKTSTKSGGIYKGFRFDMMRPAYAFEHFGDGGKSIYHELREGQDTLAFLAKEIIDFAKKTYTPEEVKAWSKEVQTFTLDSGEEVSLLTGQMMGIYCINKRPQGQLHLYGDGIRVSNFSVKGKKYRDAGHIVSADDVQKIIGALTPRQMEVADAMQEFMSTVCSSWGNHVSMARFDVEQFTETNYYPLNSDGRYLPSTADESPDNAGLYTLLNMGFTKETNEKAKNRIVVYNMFDVFANHTSSMAQYRAFALPVLDALKWFNYKNDVTSVKDQLARAFGADDESRSASKGYAESFVINLIRSINGTAAHSDPHEGFLLRSLHLFNRAQIAYNSRVVIQQPLAITRAATILDPAKLAKGIEMSAGNLKLLAEEMEAHSGIALWKQFGFFDANASRGLTEIIKQDQTFVERYVEAGTWFAGEADRFTWAAMWYAARETVNRNSYTTEEAYWSAVKELFEDVIYKTQVVDSVLTKTEIARAQSFGARMITSFMSEPMTTISMVADAYYKYTDDRQRGDSRSDAWKKNGKNLGKAIAVYAIGQILFAAAESFSDAFRDDEELDLQSWWKNYWKKWWKAFKGNAVEEILPFGKIPGVSQVYGVVKGLMDYAGIFDKLGLDLYGTDISNGWAQGSKYLVNGAQILIDFVQGNKTNATWYGAIYNLLRGASGVTGAPIATPMREVVDIWNNIIGWINPRLKVLTYNPSLKKQAETAYLAYRQMEYSRVDLIREQVGDDKKLNAELKKLIKQDFIDGRVPEKASVDHLVKWAGMEYDDAVQFIRETASEKETGIKYDDIQTAFESGDIDAQTAAEMLNTYGNTASGGTKVEFWKYQDEHPDSTLRYDDYVTFVDKYEKVGMSAEQYDYYVTAKKGLKKKADIMEVIDELDLTDEQKDALYFMNNWAESTLADAPWHKDN